MVGGRFGTGDNKDWVDLPAQRGRGGWGPLAIHVGHG